MEGYKMREYVIEKIVEQFGKNLDEITCAFTGYYNREDCYRKGLWEILYYYSDEVLIDCLDAQACQRYR